MLWNLFVMLLLSSSLFLLVFYVGTLLLKGLPFRQQRWLFRFQFISLLLLLFCGACFVGFSDSELAARCLKQLSLQSSSLSFTGWIAGSWAVGCFALLAIDAFRIWHLAASLKQLKPLNSPDVRKVIDELCSDLRLSTNFRVLETPERTSPFVTGVYHPSLVLPRELIRSASPNTLKSLLAHELVHLKEKDSLWLLIDLFCRRILFFHPLALLVSISYRRCVEKAADEQSLFSTGLSTKVFANSLIQVAEFCRSARSQTYTVGMSREFYELQDRIQSLYQTNTNSFELRKSISVLISVFAWGASIAQAEMTVRTHQFARNNVVMCTQAQHERMIESLFTSPVEQNKCESNSQENLCKF